MAFKNPTLPYLTVLDSRSTNGVLCAYGVVAPLFLPSDSIPYPLIQRKKGHLCAAVNHGRTFLFRGDRRMSGAKLTGGEVFPFTKGTPPHEKKMGCQPAFPTGLHQGEPGRGLVRGGVLVAPVPSGLELRSGDRVCFMLDATIESERDLGPVNGVVGNG
ncbi:hypothetical protein N7533_002592 [Penicillium manginii]|jgi:hypothetical protein|uniref:uncharacterized protein n=1 Tax=Penicillium manginii TaxID=203109 RepID=UPI002547E50C|nr:uncharacterized protein N7533_002592 [Penicillium manginii]KAJ5763911.1 hypothetical protein N7533_002592 [Penicillium manginii]